MFSTLKVIHWNEINNIYRFWTLKYIGYPFRHGRLYRWTWNTLTSMGAELQSQNRVELCYGKTVGLGTWLAKALCKSNISLCLSQNKKSLAQNWLNGGHLNLTFLNGRCRLNFWATPFTFNQFFETIKMVPRYLVKISFSFWFKKTQRVLSPSIETSMI